jgi:hypothetical protein
MTRNDTPENANGPHRAGREAGYECASCQAFYGSRRLSRYGSASPSEPGRRVRDGYEKAMPDELNPLEVARMELDVGGLPDQQQRVFAARAYGLFEYRQETLEEIAQADGVTVQTVHLRLRKLHADLARVQMERRRRAEQYRRDSVAQAKFAAQLDAFEDAMWSLARQECRERKALCRVSGRPAVVRSRVRRVSRASTRGDPSPDEPSPLGSRHPLGGAV